VERPDGEIELLRWSDGQEAVTRIEVAA